MRLGKYWALFEPLGQPEFVTRFTDPDGVVGVEFFEEWARANGWAIGPESLTPGLFDQLEQLHCDAFDATAVDPLVRELYERTTTVSFIAERPQWTPMGWLMHSFYNRTIAHRMRQLNAPLVEDWFPTRISSRITPVRPTAGGPVRHRGWVRVYKSADDEKEGIFYTASVSHHETDGWSGTQRYLVAVLPLKYGSMTVVFQPENLPGGGFAIDTVHPGSYDGGTYLVIPGRELYCMIPAGVRDQIRLHPRWDESGRYLEGAHNTWGFGIRGYTIPYTIRAGEQTAYPPPPVKEALPKKLSQVVVPDKTTVVIAGSGPAGLAAATALSERGIEVLLVEAAPVLGGKCYTRRDDSGRSHGHGVHGWWPSYLNFNAMLRSAGIDPEEVLRPAWGGGLLLPSGAMGYLRNPFVLLPPPLHLLSSLRDLDMGTLRDLLEIARFAIHVLAFDHQRDYARYDGMTLTELATQLGVSEKAMDLFLRPFAFSFDYAQPEEVSASSILSAMQFYMLPSSTALQPYWCRGLEHERMYDGIGTRIFERGGRIAVSTQLESIEIQDGKVVAANVRSVSLQDGADEIADIPLASVPLDGYIDVISKGGKIFVGRFQGAIRVFSSVCPHFGMRVTRSGGGFLCPSHSSWFAADGSLSTGPALKGLAPLKFEERGDRLIVLGAITRRRVECSDVIIATSVRPAAEILGHSPGVPERLLTDVQSLRTTPVIVIRLWFAADAPIPVEHESIVLPHGKFVDVMFHLTKIGQSRSEHGTVVEVHCACGGRKSDWKNATDDELIAAAIADLVTIAPALTQAHLDPQQKPEVQRHGDTFTLYSPGDAQRRPGARTEVTGLTLAGDWTSADWSVWMMERAVVSGLRAANVVLEAHGQAAATIERLPNEGWLMGLSRRVARMLRGMVK